MILYLKIKALCIFKLYDSRKCIFTPLLSLSPTNKKHINARVKYLLVDYKKNKQKQKTCR